MLALEPAWRLGLRSEPPAGASSGHMRVNVALGSAGRNPSLVSRRPAMATLLAPISFLEVLPMRSLHVRGVIGCYGKPFESIFVM